MARKNTAPCVKQGAAVSKASVDAVEDTANDNERQVLIALSIKIERDRRQRALDLASIYDRSPTAAISGRFDLRDMRLFGQEVGPAPRLLISDADHPHPLGPVALRLGVHPA